MRVFAAVVIAIILSSVTVTASDGKSCVCGRFVWGAELGPAIDLCGDDMSTIDIGAHFGFSNAFIDFAGVGAGINMMMSNASRMFPLYAVFRSSFSKKKKMIFADVRAGCAIANAYGTNSQTVVYASPGVGFNLAGGKTFQSYITVHYVYCGMRFPALMEGNEVMGVNQIALRIGVTF